MSLLKTAVYGILILAAALLADVLLFTKIAGAAECPKVWVVAHAPDSGRTMPMMTQIADGFDPGDECKVVRETESGIFAQVELVGSRVVLMVRYPFLTVCSVKSPCTVTLGVRNNSCTAAEPKVVYADGAAETNTAVRRVKAGLGYEAGLTCESETIVVAYLAAPRALNTPRLFAATVDLK